MGAIASTAADIITGALLNLNAYSPAQTLSPQDGTVGLQTLNDLLDSLSNDECFVPYQVETIFTWVSGQYEYTVGNPISSTTFTGVLTSGSNAITSVASLPQGILATSGNQIGSTLTDVGSVIPSSTAVAPTSNTLPYLQTTSNLLGAPTTVNQLGVVLIFTGTVGSGATSATLSSVNGVTGGWPYVTGANNVTFSDGETRSVTFTQGSTSVSWITGLTNTVTAQASAPNIILMSAAATATPATDPDTVSFTIPGMIPIARPLRFRSGFTRASAGGSGNANLDYSFTFVDFDTYKRELLKNVQGPWPYIATYQPGFPYGIIYVYPNPSAGYVGHLFSDYILSNFASTATPYAMPQGYTRALKKLLALDLAPIYGKMVSADLRNSAKEAKDLLKGTNATPVKTLQYDTSIARAQATDAGWILHGGFRGFIYWILPFVAATIAHLNPLMT
jgi:hypothetical protein